MRAADWHTMGDVVLTLAPPLRARYGEQGARAAVAWLLVLCRWSGMVH